MKADANLPLFAESSPILPPDPPTPPQRRIFAVSEFNQSIQHLLSQHFSRVWVAGEISGLRVAASGHHYFCLKDSEAQIKCVLFRSNTRFSRLKPQDGLGVALFGSLEVYSARGEYQFLVERLELFGTGSLQAAFEQLKAKLVAEGLFATERKKQLPRFPWKIGVVTSPTGAVIQDILHVLGRRFPGLHIRLFPAQVQGEGSVEQLCEAVSHFDRERWADLVIVARGGGSLEDLWSFNNESLARVIAAASVPIISAVGHETDFTIADFVADYRAPTPSAAAEIAVCTKEMLSLQLTESQARLLRAVRFRLMQLARAIEVKIGDGGQLLVRRAISHRSQRVDEADGKLRSHIRQSLEVSRRRLNQLQQRLQETNLALRFARNRHRGEILEQQLMKVWRKGSWERRQRLTIAQSHLIQLSPLSVLARGYSIVEKSSGQIVRAATDAVPGEGIRVRLHAGSLKATVSGTIPGGSDSGAHEPASPENP